MLELKNKNENKTDFLGRETVHQVKSSNYFNKTL